MDLAAFRKSLERAAPPKDLALALQALWWDAKGDWAKGHDLINDEPGKIPAWVHAYLHRKEGDLSNARYWYGQAGKPESKAALDEEWAAIAASLLKQEGA